MFSIEGSEPICSCFTDLYWLMVVDVIAGYDHQMSVWLLQLKLVSLH